MANKQIEKMIRGLNILIVDDNAYMRRLTRTMLTNLGGKSVLEAPDGLAALEAIRTFDPDVMLLDWDMPVLNGLEVLRIVRSPGVSPRPNIPVIMLTTRAQRAHVYEALDAGQHESRDDHKQAERNADGGYAGSNRRAETFRSEGDDENEAEINDEHRG
jgi:two-component system chemotaxis response regulator CheY